MGQRAILQNWPTGSANTTNAARPIGAKATSTGRTTARPFCPPQSESPIGRQVPQPHDRTAVAVTASIILDQVATIPLLLLLFGEQLKNCSSFGLITDGL